MKKLFIFLIVIGIFLMLYLAFWPKNSGYGILEDFDGKISFYKSGSCGCCDVHSNYLRSKGNLDVEEINLAELDAIKIKYGVPRELESCHTAVIGDYFVEGHIPIEAIEKMLQEKPEIKGIAMPGMPSGAPGMPGAKKGDFVIYTVKNDGSYEEFMRI